VLIANQVQYGLTGQLTAEGDIQNRELAKEAAAEKLEALIRDTAALTQLQGFQIAAFLSNHF
jgi:hypothetical protein